MNLKRRLTANPDHKDVDLLQILDYWEDKSWSDKEHELFAQAVRLYGPNFDMIEEYIGGSKDKY